MIGNKARFKQCIDFGNLIASDIDMVMEFDDKYLLLFEVKLKGVKMKYGQELLLKRVANAWDKSRKAFIFICEHETEEDEIIDIFDCTIVEIRQNNDIQYGKRKVTDVLKKIALHYHIFKLEKLLDIN